MLIREALAQGSADLKFAEISSPSLDASILLSHILKIDKAALIVKGNEKIKEKDTEAFCSLIEKRAMGECVAYLIGKKEFRGLEFEVNKSVLVPRPDTETLVEAAIEILTKEFHTETHRTYGSRHGGFNSRVLDLCTGSGVVIIALKNEIQQIEAHATDISLEALETAKTNASRLLPKEQIKFLHGDLFHAIPDSFLRASVPQYELFSLITSNPPYIPSAEIETLSPEVQNEPRLALDGGDTGLDIIKRIIEDSPDYLQSNGRLLLEADPRQMNEITILLAKKGFKDIQLYCDLTGAERVIGGRIEK